jgi:hypothetical protein
MKILINAYRTLNNILLMSEKFLMNILNISTEACQKFHEEIFPEKSENLLGGNYNFQELIRLFETFKNFKTIYSSELTEKEINSFIIFYSKIIEKDDKISPNSCSNYSGCIELLKSYSKFNKEKLQNEAFNLLHDKKFENSFGSQFTKENLDKINNEYIHKNKEFKMESS